MLLVGLLFGLSYLTLGSQTTLLGTGIYLATTPVGRRVLSETKEKAGNLVRAVQTYKLA